MKEIQILRQDSELPLCIENWGWKYHHLGIPTNIKMPNERYLPHLKFYVSGFSTCPFGIEWMRFEEDCPISDLIKSVPHIAFEVDDIDKELKKHDFEIISEPSIPSDGVRAAMIKHNGAPIELIEFKMNK
ncbi:MAG: hypothetical protein WC513_09745 [Bacteroidales bacterium]|jgi:hypothetical protein|nr:hypothetical protein [Proteiniphilum sp.]MDY0354231.1 hypothetical protein [Bacteroidales bacterium]